MATSSVLLAEVELDHGKLVGVDQFFGRTRPSTPPLSSGDAKPKAKPATVTPSCAATR